MHFKTFCQSHISFKYKFCMLFRHPCLQFSCVYLSDLLCCIYIVPFIWTFSCCLVCIAVVYNICTLAVMHFFCKSGEVKALRSVLLNHFSTSPLCGVGERCVAPTWLLYKVLPVSASLRKENGGSRTLHSSVAEVFFQPDPASAFCGCFWWTRRAGR